MSNVGSNAEGPPYSSSREVAKVYDATYYARCGDGVGYERKKCWMDLFGNLAGRLIDHLQPKTALDAGCAKGFLVESLRVRGVEAYGVDISAYAIAEAHESIRPYCREGLLTDPLGGPYDLVTCIEVIEHLPPQEEALALQRLTEASDTIFFSSSPDDFDEPTHFNVRPMRYWLDRFAALGYYPDPSFDSLDFVYQSFLLKRRRPDESAFLDAYSGLLDMRQKYVYLKTQAAGGPQEHTDQEQEQLEFRVRALESRISAMERSVGWRILTGYRDWLRNSIRSRPFIAKVYEPLASGLVAWMAGNKVAAVETASSPDLAESVIAHAATGGDVLLNCNYPPDGKITRAMGTLMVEGWAASRTGIDRVEVQIGIHPPYRAKFGQSSAMIAACLPDFAGADHAYFRCEVPVVEIPEGSHYLEVHAYAKDGDTAKVVRQVVIDHGDAYGAWLESNGQAEALGPALADENLKISIVTPVFRTPLLYLRTCIESVIAQTYSNWELCLVDDASGDPEITAVLEQYAAQDARIRFTTLGENQGIAVATNAAIAIATGDYIGFLDHDDELAPVALAEVASAIQNNAALDVLYSDEDMMTTEGVRYGPVFKPTFSLELLRSCNYVCHFLVVRASLAHELKGIRTGFDGSQDYDFILRLAERTSRFHRIPHVLYHWRAIPGSTALSLNEKPAASMAGLRALQDHLDRIGLSATATERAPCRYGIRYRLPEEPAVLIVVPTGGNLTKLRACVRSVLKVTEYGNFQLMIADNSRGPETEEFLRQINDPRLVRKDFRGEPFNFSRICNQAVAGATAKHLLFLNDDTEVTEPEWLRVMVELAELPGAGVVGARLLYPDGSLQHAGVLLGVYGLCGHAFRLQDSKEGHYMTLAASTRNYSAVTGACLLTPRQVFADIGGFDEEEFPVNLQDVDYCLKVNARGLRVIYTPDATLMHYETSTRKEFGASEREIQVMRERWGAWIDDDPYYNPNLTRTREDFSLRLD